MKNKIHYLILLCIALLTFTSCYQKPGGSEEEVRVEDMLALLDAQPISVEEVMKYLPKFASSYETEVTKAISGKSDVATVAELVRNSENVGHILQILQSLTKNAGDKETRFEMDRLTRRIATKHSMLDDFARERAMARRHARGDDRYDFGDRERMESMEDSMKRLEAQLKDSTRIEGFVPNDEEAELLARKKAEEQRKAQEAKSQSAPTAQNTGTPAKVEQPLPTAEQKKATPTENTQATPAKPSNTVPKAEEKTVTSTGKYHVVVGSFQSMEQAKAGAAEFPGCSIRTYNSNGKTAYRLIAATTSTYDAAKAASKRINHDSWIWEEK